MLALGRLGWRNCATVGPLEQAETGGPRHGERPRTCRCGEPAIGLTKLDNQVGRIDLVKMGDVYGTSVASTGSCYLDDFASFRTLAPQPATGPDGGRCGICRKCP